MIKKTAKTDLGKISPAGHYPSEATVGDQSERQASDGGVKAAADRGANEDSSVRERIAKKAYEIFKHRGGVHGQDLEHWLEAERQILLEIESEKWRSRGRKNRRRVYQAKQD